MWQNKSEIFWNNIIRTVFATLKGCVGGAVTQVQKIYGQNMRISVYNVQLPHKNLVINKLKAPQQRDIQSAEKNLPAQMSAKRNP